MPQIQKEMKVVVPADAGNAAKAKEVVIVITVKADGVITVDNKPLTKA